ncbi:MAG: protein SCO1/2, partial [Gammaproteobacteria bacterium]
MWGIFVSAQPRASMMATWVKVLGFAVVLVAGFFVGKHFAPPEMSTSATVKDAVPVPLHLVDHNGQRVEVSWLRGHVSLVFFGYTHCPDICPATLAQMRLVKDALGSQAEQLRGVFITVDPARDTP